MEYIGLLGLIGLLGFFTGRSLGQDFDKLKNEFRRAAGSAANAESRVGGVEKNIAAVKDDLQQLKGSLQTFATADDLNKNSRRLQSEWHAELQDALKNFSDAPKNFEELFARIGALEEKSSAPSASSELITLQSNLKMLQLGLEKQRTDFDIRLKKIEARPESPPPIVQPATNLENRIAALEAERQTLMTQLTQYKNFFAQFQLNLDALRKDFDALKKSSTDLDALRKDFDTQKKSSTDFESLRKELDALKNFSADFDARIKKLEKPAPIPQPTPPPPAPKSISIRDFHIKKRSGALFTKKAELENALAVVTNLAPLTSFLKTAPPDKSLSFNRILKNYQQNLSRFAEKIRRAKFDEETFSEEVSEKFFAVLSKYFLATIPVAIYRGRNDNPKFYADFLAKVNEYLATCHVYSELVEPKKLVTDKQIEWMTIFKKDTSVRAEDKFIDEVEQLPYFFEYLSDDGSSESFRADGKMILLKFDGGN